MNGAFAESPEALEERCATFVEVQAWPLLEQLNWKAWLGNFTSDDECYFARCLLEAFLYYNTAHSDALYRAAFHGLSRSIIRVGSTPAEGTAAWQEFLRSVVITYVEGEHPSPTDSGFTFARRARKLFGIPEDRILGPAAALDVLAAAPATPVVFVDDILGSGKQLETMWRRDYGHGYSFSSIAASATLATWYIPLLATEYGVARVAPLTAGVTIAPAHLISERYSALHPTSIIWRSGDLDSGRDFVERVSLRAGYGPSECWGFHQLGLAVGILDTIPDASLPLFYSERNSWRPLMRRR
jgi:hypothetical protein